MLCARPPASSRWFGASLFSSEFSYSRGNQPVFQLRYSRRDRPKRRSFPMRRRSVARPATTSRSAPVLEISCVVLLSFFAPCSLLAPVGCELWTKRSAEAAITCSSANQSTWQGSRHWSMPSNKRRNARIAGRCCPHWRIAKVTALSRPDERSTS